MFECYRGGLKNSENSTRGLCVGIVRNTTRQWVLVVLRCASALLVTGPTCLLGVSRRTTLLNSWTLTEGFVMIVIVFEGFD